MKHVLVTLLVMPLLAQPSPDAAAEKRRALMDQFATHVRQSSKPLANEDVDAYVRAIGNRLLSNVPANDFRCTFETLVSDGAEPEVAPGGEVFIPANFILAARDESEFAAMLAHSIGHVVLHHGWREAPRGAVVNITNIPLVFLAPLHVDAQSGSVIPLGWIPERRRTEMDADRFAVELVNRAGYDTRAFGRYLERTHAPRSRLWPAAEHAQRLAAIEEYARVQASAVKSDAEFGRIQATIRKITRGGDEDRPPTLRRKGEVRVVR
jgi:predicted Zn-dependent protease